MREGENEVTRLVVGRRSLGIRCINCMDASFLGALLPTQRFCRRRPSKRPAIVGEAASSETADLDALSSKASIGMSSKTLASTIPTVAPRLYKMLAITALRSAAYVLVQGRPSGAVCVESRPVQGGRYLAMFVHLFTGMTQ